MRKQKVTKEQVYEAVAKSLREFGYPDATADMIKDTHVALAEGKTGSDLPHGIVGMFAEKQIGEAVELGILTLDET